jgi:hypothetical protein
MLRNCLAGALALLLSFAPITAQSIAPDCMRGQARGAWNLPAGDQSGQVRGLLSDANGRRLVLQARLAPLPGTDGTRGGSIEGLLYPVRTDALRPAPVAAVVGTYVLGRPGRGTFEAAIVEIAKPDERPAALGKLGGVFADPARRGMDPVGTFSGRWAVCR